MERYVIPLKEDCSFEILELSDGDEDPVEKTLNPKDENEFVVKEKKDTDTSDNTIRKWIACDDYNEVTSRNFSSLSMESVEDPVTIYSTDIKEFENIEYDYPVFSSNRDKMMTSYSDKKSETNGTISLNSEPIYEYISNEKFDAIPDRPYDILVGSTEKFNCSQVQKQYASGEFSNYGNTDSIQGEYSTWVSKCDQRNETQSAGIVFEEVVENNETPEFLRTNCNRKCCQLMDNGIQFCSWLRSRPSVQRFVKKAKASLKSIASTVELEINQILSSEKPLRLSIISDELSAQAIEDAFTEVFRGRVLASAIIMNLGTIPALPIGNSAGLQGAEMKINYARQYNLAPDSSVAVSTSILLQEAVSQRWQMTTVVYLDDPNLPMNLHNFTATTPIPNQYVMEAERQTLPNYHLRDYGLSVDIKQAIDSVTKMTLQDPQEFLTGVSYYSTIKSAALMLAGMYKKYVIK